MQTRPPPLHGGHRICPQSRRSQRPPGGGAGTGPGRLAGRRGPRATAHSCPPRGHPPGGRLLLGQLGPAIPWLQQLGLWQRYPGHGDQARGIPGHPLPPPARISLVWTLRPKDQGTGQPPLPHICKGPSPHPEGVMGPPSPLGHGHQTALGHGPPVGQLRKGHSSPHRAGAWASNPESPVPPAH